MVCVLAIIYSLSKVYEKPQEYAIEVNVSKEVYNSEPISDNFFHYIQYVDSIIQADQHKSFVLVDKHTRTSKIDKALTCLGEDNIPLKNILFQLSPSTRYESLVYIINQLQIKGVKWYALDGDRIIVLGKKTVESYITKLPPKLEKVKYLTCGTTAFDYGYNHLVHLKVIDPELVHYVLLIILIVIYLSGIESLRAIGFLVK